MKIKKQIIWCLLLFSIEIGFSQASKAPAELKVHKVVNKSWSGSVRVMYDLNRKADVRCAIYNEVMEPIGLQTEYNSVPPMDYMTFHLADKNVIVKLAKCWILEE